MKSHKNISRFVKTSFPLTLVLFAMSGCDLDPIAPPPEGPRCPSNDTQELASIYLDDNTYCNSSGCHETSGEPCSSEDADKCDYYQNEQMNFFYKQCPDETFRCADTECRPSCTGGTTECGAKCCSSNEKCDHTTDTCISLEACVEGELQCSGKSLMKCIDGVLQPQEDCPGRCDATTLQCVNCTDGERQCATSDGSKTPKYQICVGGNWEERNCAEENGNPEMYCSAGECVECTVEPQICKNNVIMTCVGGKWDKDDCASRNLKCDSNMEDLTCIQCLTHETSCVDSKTRQYCDNGVFKKESCPYGCDNGICQAQCTSSDTGAKSCQDNKVVVCDGGSFVTQEDCTSEGKTCKEGRCTECTPGTAPTCKDGQTLRTCDTGGSWNDTKCPYKCSNNQCIECDSTTPKCANSNTVQTCSSGKYVTQSCPAAAPICQNGNCVACIDGDTKGCQNGKTVNICSNGTWTTANCRDSEVCISNRCEPGYLFVKLTDETTESNSLVYDPGADIDAICTASKTNCAKRVIEHSPTSKDCTDPNKVLGQPDAFAAGNNTCHYKAGDVSSGQCLTYALGGNYNYIMVEMQSALLPNETLNVYEIGYCTLYLPDKSPSYNTRTEPFNISVSKDGTTWVNTTSVGASEANHGIINYTVRY